MTTVYSASSYGSANIFVRPGMDEPDNDRWFEVATDEHGEVKRRARQFLVRFQKGSVEIEEDLARYMIAHKLASARPLRIVPRPPMEVEYEKLREPPVRKPPMQVGRPLTPEGGTPAPPEPTLRERVKSKIANIFR